MTDEQMMATAIENYNNLTKFEKKFLSGWTKWQDRKALSIIKRIEEDEHHQFKVNLGSGHVANIHVPVEEFAQASDSSPDAPTTAPAPLNHSELNTAIQQAIKPLRKDILALQEKRYWQDVLGGIGYIFGLFGIAACTASLKTWNTQSSTPHERVL